MLFSGIFKLDSWKGTGSFISLAQIFYEEFLFVHNKCGQRRKTPFAMLMELWKHWEQAYQQRISGRKDGLYILKFNFIPFDTKKI